MKEAKRGICKKCNKYFYIHNHHILPKSKFGKEGETVELCPNCHTHFHEFSNIHTGNPNDADEARSIWNIWFTSITVSMALLLIGYFLFM